MRAGLGAVTAFVVLRMSNLYGDPSPWSRQDSPLFTVLSFLNATKYPPSLLFLLVTSGMSLLFRVAIARQVSFTPPPDWGFALPIVYAVWILVVASLYWPSRKVAELKATGRYPWLSYF